MFDPTAFLGRGWTGPGELTGWEDWERREPMRFDFADFPGAKLAGLTFATICTRSTTNEVVNSNWPATRKEGSATTEGSPTIENRRPGGLDADISHFACK
jgi:hypothetical protein